MSSDRQARRWLESEALLGLAPNTIEAYGRAVDGFLSFCRQAGVTPLDATKADIAAYVGALRKLPGPRGANVVSMESGMGLSNATLQQRITAVRLFFDFLVEDNLRESNPVGRGRYTPGNAFGSGRERSLVPRFHKLPWIPTETQWGTFLAAAKSEPIRNRCMLALAYDAALRREELCLLDSNDIDPAHRLLHIRAETTKGHRGRTVPYSAATGILLRDYLAHRRGVTSKRGALFLSESHRNSWLLA